MIAPLRATIAALAVVAAGCQPAPKSATDAARASAPVSADATTRFAASLATSFAARDAHGAAALFAEEATSSLVGEAGEAHGRAAIEESLGALLAAHTRVTLSIGRVWVGDAASVVEIVFRATTASGRSVGLVAASVVTFDARGLVTSQRVYADVATYLAQADPARLPEGTKVRPEMTALPAGAGVLVARGTPEEARNLAVADGVWAALEDHRADDATAPMTDDYVYDDFGGPAPLTKDGTRELVRGFLGALRSFRANKPVDFAAGDDVVTETDEVAVMKGEPADKRIALHGITVMRIVGGKIVRQWQYANSRELLRQLGDR